MILQNYPLLILLAPLAAALATGILGAKPESRPGRKVYGTGVLMHVAAFGLSVWVLHEVATPGQEAIRIPLFSSPWSGLAGFELSIDRLAAVMMVLITGISTLIFLFSIRYMQFEHGRARFHTLLALTVFVLLCMVSSANLLMLFLFWQLLSWLLYQLLAYNYSQPPTVQVAFKTYIVLRVGDVAFLSGIVLAYGLYGTLDLRDLFERAAEAPAILSLWPGSVFSISAATAITLLIFIGAMSKSAQFPLHGWLPDSMYIPTPVSALMHAGIVNGGGFLLNRLAPLYGLSSTTLHVVFIIGAITAFLGASMMLTQNDIKKTLGYSTMGQMGYMIMECGLGAFALAIFHLVAHGLFKATLFLHSGSGIRAARKEPRFPAKHEEGERADFSRLAWITGFVATLILPLVILLATHGLLNIPLRDSQGAVILLFFAWVTSSQAIISLYRLQAVSSWKVAGAMILTLVLVVFTYLLAAETFAYFLYPGPGKVAYYFQAASLPVWMFDLMVVMTALIITLGWIFIYAKSHGQSILMPGWVSVLRVRLYILFMNRLYLDTLALKLGGGFMRVARRLDSSRLFPYVTGLIALGLIMPAAVLTVEESAANIGLFIVAALTIPLFPLHGVYVAALTRLPGYWPACLAILLPAAGYYGLLNQLPNLPPDFLGGVRLLAMFGALYGSFKALVQIRVMHLLSYGSLAFYSILWWHLAITGSVTPGAAIYAAAVAMVTGGLLLAWDRVRVRYGDLGLNQIGGLAHPMPRFAMLLALLVMAAAGLPPFGLFSGYIALLLNPLTNVSFGSSVGLTIIVLTWFTASWYLFKLMQRILWGPHRSDLRYEDLSHSEAAPLVLVLALLLAIGILPNELAEFVGTNTLTPRNP